MTSRARAIRPLLAATVALAGLGASVPACRPDLGPPPSLVTEARILAIRADPPEAKPGEVASYLALVVGPAGVIDAPGIAWGFCASPKPLTENDAVSKECLRTVRPIEDPVQAATPLDVCRLFGPDPPPGGLRPRDPDATGGFFQPVRATYAGLVAFRLQRVTCELPAAPIDVAIDFGRRRRPNQNPTLGPLTLAIGGAPARADAIPAGARVELTTGWGEGDAERFVLYDQATRALVERQEVLSVSWFVTGGTLAEDVTGPSSSGTSTVTAWEAPRAAGRVLLWTVLRDDRGGVDFAAHALDVAAR